MPALVPAAMRTMALFEVFSRERRPLANAELAKFLELPESSCSDLVNTLLNCGYLMKVGHSRRVYPTDRLQSVAHAIEGNNPVLASMREVCEWLRDETGESALCGRVEDGAVRVLVMCEGRHPLRYAAATGDRISLHVSALGKAILALGSDEEAARMLQIKPRKPLATGTLTDLDALVVQIGRFRRQGYALVESEGGEDLAAMAIAGTLGAEAYAVSVVGPVGRLRLHRERYLQGLGEAARKIFGAG